MKYVRLSLLVYNYLFVFIVLIAAVLAKNKQAVLLPGILLFPVVLYFAAALTDRITKFSYHYTLPYLIGIKQVLKAYSFTITSLLFVAGIIFAQASTEYLFAFLLAPLPIFFLSTWRNSKPIKTLRYMVKFPFHKQEKSKSKTSSAQEKTTITSTTNPAADTDKKPTPAPTSETLTLEPNEQPTIVIDSIETTTEPSDISTIDNPDQNALLDEVSGEELSEEEYATHGIKDIDRRQFLKLLGGSTLGILAMSMFFPQKASAAFFGSVPGPGVVAIKDSSGDQIDPAEKGPTDGYNVSEIDDSSTPSYYGFVNKDGNWYISEESATGSYRYIKGAAGFSTNWTNRASLTYDYFDNVF